MVIFLSVTAIIIALVIFYIINTRRFNRRNFVGLELFSSYGNSLLIRFMESFFGLLAWLLLLAGIFFLLASCYNAYTASQHLKDVVR